MLDGLEAERLITITSKDGREWTIYVEDPREVAQAQTKLRLADESPQGELFDGSAVSPPLPPCTSIDELEIQNSHSNTSPGDTAAITAEVSSAESVAQHPSGPPTWTVDRLVELWLHTSRAYVGDGRKRDKPRTIRPMIQATLDAGVPAEVIAQAMRERQDTLEWYQAFHARLISRKNERLRSDDVAAQAAAILKAQRGE